MLTADGAAAFERAIARGRELLHGRTIWNVNSTARGGGVAEMLRSLIGYVRGAGLDARWVVIEGDPEFFRVTKRLHNRLHGARRRRAARRARAQRLRAPLRGQRRGAGARVSGRATSCCCTTRRRPA